MPSHHAAAAAAILSDIILYTAYQVHIVEVVLLSMCMNRHLFLCQ